MDHMGNHNHHHHMGHNNTGHMDMENADIGNEDMVMIDELDMKMNMDMDHMGHMDHSERIFLSIT